MTLLVDVANVVGSRPDGWWRDRVGATSRLLARLATLDDAVVAVVEGQARAVDDVPGVRVVRAPGSGDDALVATAHELAGPGPAGAAGGGSPAGASGPLVVVTADRGLRERLPAGTVVHGPGWLLDQL